MNSYLFAFFVALAASLFLTSTVRDWALTRGWVDLPDSVRKLHPGPIPRLGGIAIYLSMLIALALVCLLPTNVARYLKENLIAAITILGLSGLMLLVGVWDDLKGLSAWKKFSAQIVLSVASWALGFRILESWGSAGSIHPLGILSLPLTIIWIVGVTNAFNLIDGIDGLSAGAALFAMISMIVLSIANNIQLSPVLLVALAGATLGLLRYNFNPASIFLGDSGSQLLGFMLALLAIRNSQKSPTAFAIAVPIVAFGLPVVDTAMAIIRRYVSGRPIFSGDRKHIHHVLMERGLTTRGVVILLYGVCGLFGLISLLFINPVGKTAGLVLAILGACVWFGIQQLRYPELKEMNAHFSRSFMHQRKLIAGSVAVGKMREGMRRAQGLEELLQNVAVVLQEMSFSRLELRLPTQEGSAISPGGQWKMVTGEPGRQVLQWSLPCLSCPTLLDEKRDRAESLGSDCDDCGVMKGSLFPDELREGLKKTDSDFKMEFEVRLSRSHETAGSDNGNKLPGSVTFYHPASVQYPVSAMSVLSQNIGLEFETALQRILSNGN
ncbi:MAG: undecaprenyl/decaprenyl-phosphate alpha-N-acetylglucosaminyl 1-phosphate transferase [Acidobacteriia bacterium]|nr:undecaprenyl/decaprenyl-phosphate alpha-N-acetylglucosaminyl 1-phosphate transferase [Terriglobia bacterium]